MADALPRQQLFQSFFIAGFECATHRVRSGGRLDMVAATQHDRFALQDYRRLEHAGLRVAREGVRWHIVERTPGHYDFSSALPIARAARQSGTQVIWDLCHFGWPDHLDIFKPAFVSALARFGAAFAHWLARESDGPQFIVPINEISFFSWAAGDEGSIHPFVTGRGLELKVQLVRAAIETMNAIRADYPRARFVHVDPVIHVAAHPGHPEERAAAENYRLLQYQAWDMVSGRIWPELGGDEKYLDILGVNFYPHNEWFFNLHGFRRIRKFRAIPRRHPLHRPFREMLAEVYARYRRPTFIAETGAEDRRRAGWLRYVCSETNHAIRQGIPIQGLCLYPIVNHPGWDDNRHVHDALWDYPDETGRREVYAPLSRELKLWQQVFENPASNRNDSVRTGVQRAAA